MQTEIFEYKNVMTEMGKIDTARSNAKAALDNGTDLINEAFSQGTNAALSGTAATQIKQKWENLAENFERFNSYIEDTEQKIQETAKANVSYEENVASTVGN